MFLFLVYDSKEPLNWSKETMNGDGFHSIFMKGKKRKINWYPSLANE